MLALFPKNIEHILHVLLRLIFADLEEGIYSKGNDNFSQFRNWAGTD